LQAVLQVPLPDVSSTRGKNGKTVGGVVSVHRQVQLSAKLCGVEQRAPPISVRAAITLGIGPHSSKIRSTGTVHTSVKARLTSVAILIRILIRIPDPDRHQNLTICSLVHCQPSLKI